MIIPKKKLPRRSHQGKHLMIVEKVGSGDQVLAPLKATEYPTKTRGTSHVPQARLFAFGVYALTQHERRYQDSIHLNYVLIQPEKPLKLHRKFNLHSEGVFVLTVKNPEAKGRYPSNAEYPSELQEKFGERKFIPPNPIELLDYEGTTLIAIGVSPEAGHPPQELVDAAEMGAKLRHYLDQVKSSTDLPLGPLRGKWQ